jgi:hypothetical protein
VLNKGISAATPKTPFKATGMSSTDWETLKAAKKDVAGREDSWLIQRDEEVRSQVAAFSMNAGISEAQARMMTYVFPRAFHLDGLTNTQMAKSDCMVSVPCTPATPALVSASVLRTDKYLGVSSSPDTPEPSSACDC